MNCRASSFVGIRIALSPFPPHAGKGVICQAGLACNYFLFPHQEFTAHFQHGAVLVHLLGQRVKLRVIERQAVNVPRSGHKGVNIAGVIVVVDLAQNDIGNFVAIQKHAVSPLCPAHRVSVLSHIPAARSTFIFGGQQGPAPFAPHIGRAGPVNT